eukprot:1670807-Rhodomonas_salina.2
MWGLRTHSRSVRKPEQRPGGVERGHLTSDSAIEVDSAVVDGESHLASGRESASIWRWEFSPRSTRDVVRVKVGVHCGRALCTPDVSVLLLARSVPNRSNGSVAGASEWP